MYVNGVRTGMAAIAAVLRPILRDRPQALTACFAAAVGATTRGTAALLIASAARPSAATSTSGFALFSPSNNHLLHVNEIHWLLKEILTVSGNSKMRAV